MGVGSEARGEERVDLSEILKEKLYFAPLQRVEDTSAVVQCLPKPTVGFNIDSELVYEPFFADFGPLNLACTYRFCWKLHHLLKEADEQDQCVLFCCSADPKKKSNAAVLIESSKLKRHLICHGYAYVRMPSGQRFWTSVDTMCWWNRGIKYRVGCSIFDSLHVRAFLAFRDPTCGISTYRLTVLDCIRAILRANRVGWIDFNNFNLEEYEYFEQVENGDLNWIVPNKLVAFSGPSAKRLEIYGYRTLVPEDYVEYFHRVGITGVVRLNRKAYDRRRFTDHGLSHYDLYFPDGSCPPDRILRRFLEIVEETTGALAVHCKAGLGRTGALMGCYIMKHYRFTCNETLGYLRIVRPGSVIGPQQHYLKDMQYRMWKAGDLMRHQLAQMNVNTSQPYNPRASVEQGPVPNASGSGWTQPSNKFMRSRRFSVNPNFRRGSLRDREECGGVQDRAAERSPPAARSLEAIASPQRVRRKVAGSSGLTVAYKGAASQDEASGSLRQQQVGVSPSPAGYVQSTGFSNLANGMGRLSVNDAESSSSSAKKFSRGSPFRSKGTIRHTTERHRAATGAAVARGSVVVQRVINSAGQPRKVVMPVAEFADSQAGQTAPQPPQQQQQGGQLGQQQRARFRDFSPAHLRRYGTPGRLVMASAAAASKWDSAQNPYT